MLTPTLRLPLLGAALSLLSVSSCSAVPKEAAAADPVNATKSEVAIDPARSIPESTIPDATAGEAREASEPIDEMRWGPGATYDAREMPPLPPEYQRMLEQYYEKLRQQQPRVR